MVEQGAQRQRDKSAIAKLLGAAVVALALVAFVVQNTDSTQLRWLFFEGSAPVWVIIVVAAVAGGALSEILSWVVRRRR